MTKTIHPNDQVAHLFAHQSQGYARSGNGNFSFSGNVALSYSTPIARIVDGANGSVALLTSERYSPTTNGKHRNALRRAFDYGRGNPIPMFEAPFIGAPGGRNRIDSPDMAEVHVGNLAYFRSEYDRTKARLMRVVKYWGSRDDMAVELYRMADQAASYARAFDLPAPAFPADQDAGECWARIERLEAKRASPEYAAQQEKARERREALYERKRAEEQARALARLHDWRNGDRGYTPRATGLPVALRIMGDEVQTSWGARFPVDHARKAWPLVKACRERGQGWRPNGHTLHLGPFAVNEIEASGNVRAGCHYVQWEEIEACARALGLEQGDK